MADLTVREAERRSGFNRGTISALESGRRTATPVYLIGLAAVYGVDRLFVLMHAGLVELPGFERLVQEAQSVAALDDLLTSATREEKLALAKHLASLRITSPWVDQLLSNAQG